MMKRQHIQEADLHAYVDHQLPEQRVEAVEAWLGENSHDANRVRTWQRQITLINEYLDEERFAKTPARLDLQRLQRRNRRRLQNFAASVLLAISGCVLGWFSHSLYMQELSSALHIAEPAMAAHKVYSVEVRHPVEVGADEEKHLVKWLSKRLDYPLKMPRLDSLGYALIGGRLLSTIEGPAAQFMFEDPQGKRITLFSARSSAERQTSFQFTRSQNLSAFYWIDDEIAYAIIGELQREKLLEISRLVYQQLTEEMQNRPVRM